MKLKNNEKGFTLIELMAVLVILGILATVVVVSVDPVSYTHLRAHETR